MKYLAVVMALLLLGCGCAGESPEPNNAAANRAGTGTAADSVAQEPEPTNAGSAAEPRSQNLSACLVQNGERIPENALHAIGTEPFWATDVKGRCVTYSTPENQPGTRIWTRFEGTAENGRWTGALDNQRFVMVTNPEPGCSDGMSDKRYPIKVTLTVRGEQRTGCAEPR